MGILAQWLLSSTVVDSLKLELDKDLAAKDRLTVLLDLSYYLTSEDNPDSQKYLAEAEKLVEEIDEPAVRAQLMEEYFYEALLNNNKEETRKYLGKTVNYAQKLDSKDYARYLRLYYTYSLYFSDYQETLKKLRIAQNIYESEVMEEEYISTSYDISQLLEWTHQYDESIAVLDDLLNNSNHQKYPELSFNIYQAIGSLYSLLGQPKLGLPYVLKALKIAEEQNSHTQLLNINNTIGVNYIDLGNYEEALKYFFEANKYAEEEVDKTTQFNNIGYCYNELGRYEEAITYLEKAINGYDQEMNKSSIANSELNIAKAYFGLEKYSQAKKYLEKGMKVLTPENDYIHYLKGLKLRYRLSEKMGNYTKAYQGLVAYNELKERVDSQELQKVINDLNAKYQTSQKNKEISLLKKDKEIQNIQLGREKQFRNFLLVIVFVVIILIIVIYISSRNHKRMNEQLYQQKNEIEKSYKELKIAQKEIIELEKRNSLLAMNVTANHEINQPLMILLGNIEMLKFTLEDLGADKKHLERCDTAFSAIKRIRNTLEKYKDIDNRTTKDYTGGEKMLSFDSPDNEE